MVPMWLHLRVKQRKRTTIEGDRGYLRRPFFGERTMDRIELAHVDEYMHAKLATLSRKDRHKAPHLPARPVRVRRETALGAHQPCRATPDPLPATRPLSADARHHPVFYRDSPDVPTPSLPR